MPAQGFSLLVRQVMSFVCRPATVDDLDWLRETMRVSRGEIRSTTSCVAGRRFVRQGIPIVTRRRVQQDRNRRIVSVVGHAESVDEDIFRDEGTRRRC